MTDALALADDALIAAQRLAEWCSRGPELEEDIALANIALDQLGTARLLLTHAGQENGRTEDDLAFLRTDREFRNCLLVELPDGDFAVTMVKLLFLAAYQKPLYESLSEDGELGPIAAKAVKESTYHLDHAKLWTIRLGDGTEESHRRAQAAVDDLWPYTHELFEPPFDPLRTTWLETVQTTLEEATLTRPEDRWRPTGGRSGVHTEHLSLLLAEMQVLHRAHPGATW
ncbi:1,2-phenylacetyl-CoA epoxidase subunit PaaC [Virgisporangium aurantiacum]|uniref:Phenylacetic acid degradation protein n=1 Tax=Virgisporangium aurantiacum TaxID=175570 RepID=A0A8J4E484_9ACTN|nr:1,2-phenylacetyl-CoA epoxidase subunit PaaC [Virgisporangium aurantiacum]GIJ61690.1 phenylacetic acid degradation protein [Virgisporangium aurantiacum]